MNFLGSELCNLNLFLCWTTGSSLVIFNPVIFVWFTVYRNTIPVPRGNTGLILTKLNKADAKSTTSYFLGPTFLGPPK